jgi:hypothetical protein
VYVNEDGFVIGWCERDAPVGNDQADLVGELERMLADAKRYPLTTKDELRKLIPEQTNEHTQGT